MSSVANTMSSAAEQSTRAPVRVLCVDDEPRILEGLENHLAMHYEVHFATSGAKGLQLLQSDGPFSVVISDMRMPEMDGASFLQQVRHQSPDSTRMLLTGQSDLESAITAVNKGNNIGTYVGQ